MIGYRAAEVNGKRLSNALTHGRGPTSARRPARRTVAGVLGAFVTLLGASLLTSCAAGQGGADAWNSLTVQNGTAEFALVRIKSVNGATHAELAIDPGQSRNCWLANGRYYEVVRFGRDERAFRFAKGEGFNLFAPGGRYITATLTLHGVVQGNYATTGATAADF